MTDNKFNQLYKKYENLVSEGKFHGDARDKVDTIIQMIYDIDDLPSGIYESLGKDKEWAKEKQAIFLLDFETACEIMIANPKCDTDEDYKAFVEEVKRFR